MKKFFLIIDQGTTSTRIVLYNKKFKIFDIAQKEFRQIFPNEGWVEHDANEIFDTVVGCIKDVMEKSETTHKEIIAIGITNQRETCLLWDKKGNPLGKAIVWQDRRTAELCNKFKKEGQEKKINQITGLLPDPYFSGTKLSWLLEDTETPKDFYMGTIDTLSLIHI